MEEGDAEERKGAEGWTGDRRGGEEMDALLFKFLNSTPMTLLQGPATVY